MPQVQIIPLGGVGEIGKNCTVVQEGDDLLIVDCGLSFPNEEMLGINIVVPDFTYLVQNKDKFKAIFLTHAHEDHVGGLPYLLDKLRVPIYCTEFTAALIRQKLDEKVGRDKYDIRIYKPGDVIKVGVLSVEPVRITHSIPENCGLAVRCSHGIIFFTGDFKFDFTPVDGKATDMARLSELGREGVVALLSDSTNVERPGWGPSERSVLPGMQAVFAAAEGRILMTTFASNIHRMQQFMDVAAEYGRKVAVVGRRMEQNIDTCERLGYINVPKGTRIKLEDLALYPPNKVAILTTGSQGEPMSALVQMSHGEYGRLQIKSGDTLVYSARPIPGNEGAIWRTINRLFQQGCKVIYDSPMPIHVSGHAYQEELKMMINLLKPFYIAPVHGEPRHQYLYNHIAKEMGHAEHRIFTMACGVPLNLDDTSAALGTAVAAGSVLVDNAGTAGVSDEILRDRYSVANEGLVIVTVPVDVTKGVLAGDPSIMAKAFSGSPKTLDIALDFLLDAMRNLGREELRDTSRVKADAADAVKRAIQRRGGARPLVVPIVIEF
jgi:ribonuclease J